MKTEEGMSVAKGISAIRYLECSAKTQEGLHNVFNEAIRGVISPPGNKRISMMNNLRWNKCALL